MIKNTFFILSILLLSSQIALGMEEDFDTYRVNFDDIETMIGFKKDTFGSYYATLNNGDKITVHWDNGKYDCTYSKLRNGHLFLYEINAYNFRILDNVYSEKKISGEGDNAKFTPYSTSNKNFYVFGKSKLE